jgi:hypothetical protein
MRSMLLTAFALCALLAGAAEPKPFRASYTTDWKRLPFRGRAERVLEAGADGSWTLTFSASMLVASVKEESTFRVGESGPVPQRYRFSRRGLGRNREAECAFDWERMRYDGMDRGEPFSGSLAPGVLDKSTLQLALQRDVASGKTNLSYRVASGRSVESLAFRVLGAESVETRVGTLDAVKVERVRQPALDARRTVLWFAKEWDYLLVRLLQAEKDGKEYVVELKDGTVGGRPVLGRPAAD